MAGREAALEEVVRREAQRCKLERLGDLWAAIVAEYGRAGEAVLGRVDRYYLLTVLLHRPDAAHPWLYARCREVEAAPDGRLDLWAREHYKSTIITFAGVIQEILRDPEITVGIFSHTKPVARKFLLQIKRELEGNRDLQAIYPDVLYADPQKEAVTWSEEKGITVKREGNPKEATIEAHGLVDGQPTGAHFGLLVYDDVVTLESVTTPEQIQKTTDAHALSDNLGARGADGLKRKWHVGTRYKFGDTYQQILERGSLIPRIYPATEDGTPRGKPVFLSQQALDTIRRDQPSAIFAAQQLLNPAAGLEAMFQKEWPRFTDIRPATLNVYIMCDPASSRKRGSDRTAILVVGIDATRNRYLLDGYAHRMGLGERWQKIRDLWRKWSAAPGIQSVRVGYERYGMRDAMEHFEERQEVEKIGFPIQELAWPAEGGNAKYDRIQRLEPDFRAGRWYFAQDPTRDVTLEDGSTAREPVETRHQAMVKASGQEYRIIKPARQLDEEGRAYSLNKMLFDELVVYPYTTHDDVLDCLSRLYDMDPAPPVIIDEHILEPEAFVDGI